MRAKKTDWKKYTWACLTLTPACRISGTAINKEAAFSLQIRKFPAGRTAVGYILCKSIRQNKTRERRNLRQGNNFSGNKCSLQQESFTNGRPKEKKETDTHNRRESKFLC